MENPRLKANRAVRASIIVEESKAQREKLLLKKRRIPLSEAQEIENSKVSENAPKKKNGIMTRMEKLEVWREKRKELMAKQKAENKQMPFVTGIFKPKTSGLKPPSSHTKNTNHNSTSVTTATTSVKAKPFSLTSSVHSTTSTTSKCTASSTTDVVDVGKVPVVMAGDQSTVSCKKEESKSRARAIAAVSSSANATTQLQPTRSSSRIAASKMVGAAASASKQQSNKLPRPSSSSTRGKSSATSVAARKPPINTSSSSRLPTRRVAMANPASSKPSKGAAAKTKAKVPTSSEKPMTLEGKKTTSGKKKSTNKKAAPSSGKAGSSSQKKDAATSAKQREEEHQVEEGVAPESYGEAAMDCNERREGAVDVVTPTTNTVDDSSKVEVIAPGVSLTPEASNDNDEEEEALAATATHTPKEALAQEQHEQQPQPKTPSSSSQGTVLAFRDAFGVSPFKAFSPFQFTGASKKNRKTPTAASAITRCSDSEYQFTFRKTVNALEFPLVVSSSAPPTSCSSSSGGEEGKRGGGGEDSITETSTTDDNRNEGDGNCEEDPCSYGYVRMGGAPMSASLQVAPSEGCHGNYDAANSVNSIIVDTNCSNTEDTGALQLEKTSTIATTAEHEEKPDSIEKEDGGSMCAQQETMESCDGVEEEAQEEEERKESVEERKKEEERETKDDKSGDEAEAMTNVVESQAEPSSEVKEGGGEDDCGKGVEGGGREKIDFPYFYKLHSDACEKLEKIIKVWEEKVSRGTMADFPEDVDKEEVLGQIQTTIGQAHLLVKKKLQQYYSLVRAAEEGRGEEGESTRGEDLQGFWDMVYIQVIDICSKFECLAGQEQNQWRSPITMATAGTSKSNTTSNKRRKKRVAPKRQQKAAPTGPCANNNNMTSSPSASEGAGEGGAGGELQERLAAARAKRLAARNKLKEMREAAVLARKRKGNNNNSNDIGIHGGQEDKDEQVMAEEMVIVMTTPSKKKKGDLSSTNDDSAERNNTSSHTPASTASSGKRRKSRSSKRSRRRTRQSLLINFEDDDDNIPTSSTTQYPPSTTSPSPPPPCPFPSSSGLSPPPPPPPVAVGDTPPRGKGSTVIPTGKLLSFTPNTDSASVTLEGAFQKVYVSITPSKRLRKEHQLEADIFMSPARRSIRLSNRLLPKTPSSLSQASAASTTPLTATPQCVSSLLELPADVDFAYCPNESLL